MTDDRHTPGNVPAPPAPPAEAGVSTTDDSGLTPDRASVTAPLDAALAARAAYHREAGLDEARTSTHTPRSLLATRNVDGASVIAGAHGLSVHGDLDAATAPLLAAMFAEPDLDHGPGFVIDLRNLRFVDLTGIRLLHDMHHELTDRGQDAHVAASTFPGAQRTLQLAVTNGLLPAAFSLSAPYVRQSAAVVVDTLPVLPGHVADVDVAIRYLPAGVGSEPTAGDFCDLLLLSADQVAIVLGDVSGHGDSATERRATLRAAARAFALIDSSPNHVLTALERFQSLLEPDDLATLWYALYTPGTGELEYAAAGHPPPLLWAGGYTDVALLEPPNAPPLGADFERSPGPAHRAMLPRGGFLVLYSDGLIERSDRDIDTQIESLRIATQLAVQTDPLPHAADVAAHLLDTFAPHPDEARDDVCVAVIGRTAHL